MKDLLSDPKKMFQELGNYADVKMEIACKNVTNKLDQLSPFPSALLEPVAEACSAITKLLDKAIIGSMGTVVTSMQAIENKLQSMAQRYTDCLSDPTPSENETNLFMEMEDCVTDGAKEAMDAVSNLVVSMKEKIDAVAASIGDFMGCMEKSWLSMPACLVSKSATIMRNSLAIGGEITSMALSSGPKSVKILGKATLCVYDNTKKMSGLVSQGNKSFQKCMSPEFLVSLVEEQL